MQHFIRKITQNIDNVTERGLRTEDLLAIFPEINCAAFKDTSTSESFLFSKQIASLKK